MSVAYSWTIGVYLQLRNCLTPQAGKEGKNFRNQLYIIIFSKNIRHTWVQSTSLRGQGDGPCRFHSPKFPKSAKCRGRATRNSARWDRGQHIPRMIHWGRIISKTSQNRSWRCHITDRARAIRRYWLCGKKRGRARLAPPEYCERKPM